jgi:hypothetical protein
MRPAEPGDDRDPDGGRYVHGTRIVADIEAALREESHKYRELRGAAGPHGG